LSYSDKPWIQDVIDRIRIPRRPRDVEYAPAEGEEEVSLPFRIERGRFTTPDNRVYIVEFSRPYSDIPTVACIATVRGGEVSPEPFAPPSFDAPALPRPSVNLPEIEVPEISVPEITEVREVEEVPEPSLPSLDLPDETEPNWEELRQALYNFNRQRLDFWGITNYPPFSWIADAIASWKTDGQIEELQWLWDNIINRRIFQWMRSTKDRTESWAGELTSSLTSYLSNVRSKLNATIANVDSLRDGHTNLKIEIEDKWQNMVNSIRARWNDLKTQLEENIGETWAGEILEAINNTLSGFSEATRQAFEAQSRSIQALYTMLGVPRGVFATPANVHDVTTTGFEVQGIAGATFYWLSIGRD